MEQRRPQPEAVPSALPSGAHSGRVLFVDDEATLVRLAQLALTRLGFEVKAFSGANEALREFRNDPGGFDIVVTDNTMPDMDGLEFARSIRRARPDLPIVLCTGNADRVDRDEMKRSGVTKLVFKPIEVSTLAGQLTALIAEAKNQASRAENAGA